MLPPLNLTLGASDKVLTCSPCDWADTSLMNIYGTLFTKTYVPERLFEYQFSTDNPELLIDAELNCIKGQVS
jgi:hypothetical protein